MARRPILEKWRASRGHLSPQKPKLPWSYPVLAHLSVGYSELEGRLPTCYSPVRRCTQGVAPLFSHDLHVLGTPPAFVLSQDQTLQLSLENPRRERAVGIRYDRYEPYRRSGQHETRAVRMSAIAKPFD